jgi:hypothetical protein
MHGDKTCGSGPLAATYLMNERKSKYQDVPVCALDVLLFSRCNGEKVDGILLSNGNRHVGRLRAQPHRTLI